MKPCSRLTHWIDRARRSRWLVALPLALLVCGLMGCDRDEEPLEKRYGKKAGFNAAQSLNGTAVLAGMFEKAGHPVTTWNTFSPHLQDVDTIVWFPDDLQPPTPEQIKWIETWLNGKTARTLIYVGRDFDSVPHYYRAIRGLVPAADQPEIDRLTTESMVDLKRLEDDAHQDEKCSLFSRTATTATSHRDVRTLNGPWASGIDSSQVAIELNDRLEPPPGIIRPQRLLYSNSDTIVARYLYPKYSNGSRQGDESQLIVVANGSFLLNEPLVNREHRKLASRLIDEVSADGKVVFLESEKGGPRVAQHDPSSEMSDGLALLEKYPFNWILLHLAMLGIIFSFVRFPIFGIPKEPKPTGLSDFGKHVTALGEMLRKTKHATFAQARWDYYQQHVRDAASRKRT